MQPTDKNIDHAEVCREDGNKVTDLGSFTTANSVLNGIHPKPNQTTRGEGPVTGEEVRLIIQKPGTSPSGICCILAVDFKVGHHSGSSPTVHGTSIQC